MLLLCCRTTEGATGWDLGCSTEQHSSAATELSDIQAPPYSRTGKGTVLPFHSSPLILQSSRAVIFKLLYHGKHPLVQALVCGNHGSALCLVQHTGREASERLHTSCGKKRIKAKRTPWEVFTTTELHPAVIKLVEVLVFELKVQHFQPMARERPGKVSPTLSCTFTWHSGIIC